ncbi:TlpA family protein disulfide reductase [Pontibacter sp. HSC-14F20]|uniref:TlpA family protein disulfide reductase n=1 Tax=Pontibacter sp. HSC-14F20 TaxID=2864136 RepID=UPI001C72C2C3|nr:TlpA disulfide reductase family protein [Pontibacter sp. HSC-14F20]MBX0335398.1 TlpA family protein disulfide reductase [Pontibacter sp. HSC-14F20]
MFLKKWLPGPFMRILFLLLAILLQLLPGFLLPLARAQAPPPALSIGQPLPDITVTSILNSPVPSARLSDFRGKLLLLEFWSSWCGTCKAVMPKYEALQQEFPEELKILLVTRDGEERVRETYLKWKNTDGKPYSLPTAVGDSTLDQLFPYRLVPHVVWIGANGIVKAITTNEHVTAENIRLVLRGQAVPERVKRDINLQHPLFTTPELPRGNLVHYAMLLKGKVDGLPSGTNVRYHQGEVVGRYYTNKPLLDLYLAVALDLIPDYTPNRILLEVRDEGPLRPEKSPDNPIAWRSKHLYSYDVMTPTSEAGRLKERMLQDLNTYTDYRASIEKRQVKCLVLVLNGSDKKLRTKGGRTESTLFKPGTKNLRNAPVSYLINQLRSVKAYPYPLLDETGFSGHVDMTIRAELQDLPALRRELKRYNLELVEAERTLDMLVVRDKDPL